MRIDALQAFVAVAETGSFNEAARRLYLSQPGISKRLAALESRLGYRLLDRVARGVTLTEAGRAYLPHARETLAALADGDRALANLAERVEGPVSIALSHHVGMHRMPDVLRAYIAAYPAVSPQIVFADSEAAGARVLNGESELAIVTLPSAPHPRLITHPIWHDPLGLYVGPAHALAATPCLEAGVLVAHSAVLPPPESYTHAILMTAFRQAGAVPQAVMTSHSLETLRMLADIGLGWTILPTALPHRLQALTVPGLAMSRTLGVMRHPQRHLSNAARALLDMLEAEAEPEAGRAEGIETPDQS